MATTKNQGGSLPPLPQPELSFYIIGKRTNLTDDKTRGREQVVTGGGNTIIIVGGL